MLLNRMRSAVLGASALAVALGTAGCSQTPRGEPSDAFLDPQTQAQVLHNVQALNYPFESDPSYSIRIANLQTRLINECVAAQGVAPPLVQDLPLETASVTPALSRLWLIPGNDYGIADALSDPAVVAQLGDDTAGSGGGAAPPDPAAYDAAVYGDADDRIEFPIEGGGSASVPVGGCFGAATREMYGVADAADYERAYYEVPNIREVLTTLFADDSVRSATAAWSHCMAENGHDVDKPDDLYGVMNAWVGAVRDGTALVSAVREQESDLATTDLECRRSTGFGTTVSTVFLDLSGTEIRGKEGVVQEYRTMIDHAQSLLTEP